MDAATLSKRAVGNAAASFVDDGMTLGLGTGSTTAEALRAIGERIRTESLKVRGVPTSFAAERLARSYGIPLVTLDEVDRLHVAFDGADEVAADPSGGFFLVKGRGAAQTQEKVVASQADRFVVLVDPSKHVKRIGEKMPLPVEFLPMAAAPVARALEKLGGSPELRLGLRKDGPVVTDQGFWIYDVVLSGEEDLYALDRAIHSIPGVLEHGLFINLATDILIGKEDGSVEHLVVRS